MTDSSALIEQRQEFAAKQKALQDVFGLAADGDQFDFSRKTVLREARRHGRAGRDGQGQGTEPGVR